MRKSGKTHRVFMQPGLAFKQGGRKLLDFGGNFGFGGQELGYSFFFWRRVKLVETVGEVQLYTNAMQGLA
ncbi:hypothetical protein KFY34_26475 [Salmonella enterica subsp. enterica serovar 1,4,[5],12:i:-]|nr:hypothetical protein [Salmonella enterica subsp. enterica serovar 1,4,[5],12:i:-]